MAISICFSIYVCLCVSLSPSHTLSLFLSLYYNIKSLSYSKLQHILRAHQLWVKSKFFWRDIQVPEIICMSLSYKGWQFLSVFPCVCVSLSLTLSLFLSHSLPLSLSLSPSFSLFSLSHSLSLLYYKRFVCPVPMSVFVLSLLLEFQPVWSMRLKHVVKKHI